MKIIAFCCIYCLWSICSFKTAASELVGFQAVGFCYNPLGVLYESRLGYKKPLSSKTGPLWETSNFECGITNEWTPADNLLAVRFSIEPVAPLVVVAKMGIYSMYNGLGYGFYSMEKDSADQTLFTQSKETKNAHGYWLSLNPTFRAKIGKVIAIHSVTFNYIDLFTKGYFLEVRSYLPHKVNDKDLIFETFGLYEHTPNLIVGATLKNTLVNNTNVKSTKVGGLVVLKLKKWGSASPFIVVNAGGYTTDYFYKNKPFAATLIGFDFPVFSTNNQL